MHNLSKDIHHYNAVPHQILSSIIIMLLFIILSVSSMAKAFNFDAFRQILLLSQITTTSSAPVFALFIIGFEAVLTLCIIFRPTRLFALYLSTCTFSLFFTFNIYRIFFHPGIPCPCLGTMIAVPSWIMALIDILLAFASAILYSNLRKEYRLQDRENL